MYEIWLVLNILWEIALDIAPWLALLVVVWLVLVGSASRRDRRAWRAARSAALLLAVVVALLAFVSVPVLSKSALSELRYWVDWGNLAAIALGFGAAAFAFAWPLLTLTRTPSPGRS